MRKAVFLALFLSGCGFPGSVPHTPVRFPVPTRVITVQVTIKEDDTYADCIQRGGIWVRGDSNNRLNELVGCIEPDKGEQK